MPELFAEPPSNGPYSPAVPLRQRETVMDDEVRMGNKLTRFRAEQFAKWITITIALAASEHPKELRQALANVFDLEKLEKDSQVAASRLALIADEIGGARDELAQMRIECSRLKDECQRLHDRLNAAGKFAAKLETKCA